MTPRIRNLIRVYRKYVDLGAGIQAVRVLARIKELGGTDAVHAAMHAAEITPLTKGESVQPDPEN